MTKHQTPGLQVIAVTCWINALLMMWYDLENTDRNLWWLVLLFFVASVGLISLIWVPEKDRNNDPRYR